MRQKISMVLVSVIIMVQILANFISGPVKAAVTDYKFDFGAGPVQYGYSGVSASTSYNKTQGYGFNTPANMKNVTASGSGAASDAVEFITYSIKSTNTFNVDLPNGLYEIKVTLGNTSRASVAAEGVLQIINMTGNCAVDQFQIPITDGQLNILVTEGKAGTPFTLSALEIKKLSDNPVTNRTLWIGGDSTVCNYYPLDTSTQAGWGQLMPKFVNPSFFQVRNMAASGQCARGFRDDGQFEAIMKYIKPGDVFILQFGINDTNAKNNTTEAQFKEIMTDMVKQVKAKGATMVLSTPQGRSTDFSGSVHSSVNRWYRGSTLAVAQEQSVRLVDLNVLSSAYFTSIGSSATLSLFMTNDSLHPNRTGATELAKIVANDLKDILNKTPIPTPTVTPSITVVPSTAMPVVYGDVNENGKVDAGDYTLLRRYLLGVLASFSNPNCTKAADVSGDGTINVADYTLMRRFILGIITVFPADSTPVINSVIYEAEEATLSNALTENINTGYNGSSYVNYDNVTGSYVEWNIVVPESGTYRLLLRNANGTTANRPMEIKVNDFVVRSSQDFNSTGEWTTWTDTYLTVNLNQGKNVVRATAITVNGGPNVDYLKISPTTDPVVTLTPAQTPVVTPPSSPGKKPTVYIAGDSTVQSYNASYYPQAGWGQMISKYFTSDVSFVNKAIAGRSSKNFVTQGRLDEILNVIQPNDYLFVQFGHNDATISNADRYAAPYTTYKEYLAQYIDGARAKDAIPVLITPVARLNYKNNTFVNDFPDYCIAMKQVAQEKNCFIIDLMTKSLDYYKSIGYDQTYKLYLVSSNGTDYTHFTEEGATQIARLVAEGVREINIDIAKYVKY